MLLLEIPDIQHLIQTVGLKQFYLRLVQNLTEDFSVWQDFQKSSRHASYVENGVIELMPVCGTQLYSFKYVNGHPLNPKQNKLNVVAFGMLGDVETGYPLMISEMTLLTAIRTAATSALASKLLAKKQSRKLCIIGCGAQSEFQVLAHQALFNLTEVYYFDLDSHAMQRFSKNLQAHSELNLIPAESAQHAMQSTDIIITATAAPGKQKVLQYDWINPGQHIAGIGGDSPGKTELDIEILKHSKVVVEYLPQTSHEGEIQNLAPEIDQYVYAELWQIITAQKPGRTSDQDITLFDSVGFALEDYSILRLVYDLACEYQLGKEINLIPEYLKDCKNLFGLLNR